VGESSTSVPSSKTAASRPFQRLTTRTDGELQVIALRNEVARLGSQLLISQQRVTELTGQLQQREANVPLQDNIVSDQIIKVAKTICDGIMPRLTCSISMATLKDPVQVRLHAVNASYMLCDSSYHAPLLPASQVHDHVYERKDFMDWYNSQSIRKHPVTREYVHQNDIKHSLFAKQIIEGITPIFRENTELGGGIETTPIYIILDAWVRSAPNEQEKDKRRKEMETHLINANIYME
jgi:hypothetical protein